MTNSNNDIEELEELLTELEGQEAQIVTPYSEEDDAVTRLMEAPIGDQDWMVQVTALDRRMMSSAQVMSELQAGKINSRTLVWRGGMDDWLPIARVDELSRAAMPAPSAPPRMNYASLAPPPPPPPQPSRPMWSSPPAAPLPPPPAAMAPPIGMSMGMPGMQSAAMPSASIGSQMGMAPPPPVALPPPPPTPNPAYVLPNPGAGASLSSPPPNSQGNTTRPVAVDFSDMMAETDPPLQSKRWVMALSAVAILAVFVTVYSLSSGGGESDGKETAAAAEPRPVSSPPPGSSATPKEKPAATPAPSAPPKEEAKVAEASAKPSSADEDEDEARSDEPRATSGRQTAQARYSPRSEYRRRSRSGASEERSRARAEREEAEAPAPRAAVPREPEPQEEEREAPSEAVAVADEVDEPVKSTTKSGSTFNREAAKAALDEAAAQAKNCRPQGGPSGTGRVQIRYEPSGKVSNVTILTSKFENTTAGSCVRMLFRRAKVPEFTGAPMVVVNKSFEIP